MIETLLIIPFVFTVILWGYYHLQFKKLQQLQAELRVLYQCRLKGEKVYSDALKRRIAILEKIVSKRLN